MSREIDYPSRLPFELRPDQYSLLVRTTRSAIIILAPDRKILSWNQGAEQIFGYTEDEVVGVDYFERFLPADLKPEIGDVMATILSGQESRNYENRVVVRDGSERILTWNSTRLLDKHGETAGLAAIGHDITELKRGESLRAGENRALKGLVAGAPISKVLLEMAKTVESVCPDLKCLFMLSDSEGRRLYSVAVGSISEDYIKSLEGVTISSAAVCSAVAARTGKRAETLDIGAASSWGAHRQSAILEGFRSSWSEPIQVANGQIVGVISAYSSRARRPSQYEFDTVERTARLAALAIEHERTAAERIRESETRLQDAVVALEEARDELRNRFSFDDIVAVSPAMLRVMRMAAQVAPTEATILITGETGTGKEVLSRAVHANSQRRSGPFIAVNCGAIPETLMESELFGHERGAFTSADRRKLGQVERARGGTLFLDEVGELTPATQVKLLRVLQERTFERLGGTETLKADVRIVAATNRNLQREMEAGRFRDDLYYRLNVFHIHIPPLRERTEAIPLLVERILSRITEQLGRPEIAVSKLAMKVIQDYPWKGNVRELQNALERAAILSEGSLIGPEHLPISTAIPQASGVAPGENEMLVRLDENFSLEQFENELAKKALQLARGNKSEAARLLGVSRGSMRWRLQKADEKLAEIG